LLSVTILTISKTPHRKLKIRHDELHSKLEDTVGAPEG